MGNVNTVPVISQIKSAVEACGGDHEAALRTQEEFSRKCIVVSQIRSAVEAGLGNSEAALETQLIFASGIDAVPVLSQIKSAVQAGCGDMEAATKTQEVFSKECLRFVRLLKPHLEIILQLCKLKSNSWKDQV